MAPLSGAYAQNGRDILNGMLLYLEQIGYQAAGRKIELIVEDDEAIPANSLTKARKLVERDRRGRDGRRAAFLHRLCAGARTSSRAKFP